MQVHVHVAVHVTDQSAPSTLYSCVYLSEWCVTFHYFSMQARMAGPSQQAVTSRTFLLGITGLVTNFCSTCTSHVAVHVA